MLREYSGNPSGQDLFRLLDGAATRSGFNAITGIIHFVLKDRYHYLVLITNFS